MTDIKALLKQRQRRQTTEQVCLRGDLAGQYEQLEKQLAELPKNNRKLGGDPEQQRITAEMERIRAEMQDSTIEFKFEALSDPHYQQLMEEHPPRRDGDDLHPSDARWLFNWATFPPALIRACTVGPTLDAEDWDLLLGDDGMSPGQAGDLRRAVLELNGQAVDVPFWPAESSVSPD